MNKLRKLLPLLLLAGYLLVYWPPQLTAQTPNQAALVVRFGDGSVQTRCVSFSEPQISGYELLLRSGLPVIADVQGMGALVCSIDGTGCPAHDCLCQCRGSNCVYWSYWHQINGAWQYSQAGASIYPVTHGAIQGWSWGPGSISGATAPPVVEFDAVCQTAATETPTAVPPTPTLTPTASPAPEVSFGADATEILAGSCTNIYWRVLNITAVYLNGIGVTGAETRRVCPAQTETYVLRVVHGSGEETRTLTIVVLPAAATPTATASTLALATTPATATTAPLASATPEAPTAVAMPPESAGTVVETTASILASPLQTHPQPPTPAIVWVTVPPLPSPTPTPEALAALPPAPMAAPPTPAAKGMEPQTAVGWSPYLSFLALVLLLSLLIWRNTHRSSP